MASRRARGGTRPKPPGGERYLSYYNTDRVHHGRLTNGRIPADIVYGANKMKATR